MNTRRFSLLVATLVAALFAPLTAQAISFTFLEHPSLAGHYRGPDNFAFSGDDQVLTGPPGGFNPNGSANTFSLNDPTGCCGITGLNPAAVGWLTGGFTTAGNSLSVGANTVDTYNVQATTEAYGDFPNGYLFNVDSARTSSIGGAGVSTMTLLADNLLFSNLFLDHGLFGDYQSFGAGGVYLLNGQDPAAIFTGLFGGDPLEQIIIDAFNALLPLLPVDWTFVGAEVQSFVFAPFQGLLDGTSTTVFYSTDAGAGSLVEVRTPEPGTLALGGIALLSAVRLRRRRS